MAEALQLPDVKAGALNTLGTAKVTSGDESGIEDLERSIAIALEANSAECVRAYTNLSSSLWTMGQLERGAHADSEGIRAAERFGEEIGLRYLRGHLFDRAYSFGNWDESVSIADEFIASSEAGSPHYLTPDAYGFRALVRVARDDVNAAAADVHAALVLARRAKDPQLVEPALAVGAFVLEQAGDVNESEALALELLDLLSTKLRVPVGEQSLRCVWVLRGLAMEGRFLSILERARSWRWHEAARAVAEGDLVRAADTYGVIGSLPDEAYARLRAAELLVSEGRRPEADQQLQRALAFYRSVGATRYIREGEALLAAAS